MLGLGLGLYRSPRHVLRPGVKYFLSDFLENKHAQSCGGRGHKNLIFIIFGICLHILFFFIFEG